MHERQEQRQELESIKILSYTLQLQVITLHRVSRWEKKEKSLTLLLIIMKFETDSTKLHI